MEVYPIPTIDAETEIYLLHIWSSRRRHLLRVQHGSREEEKEYGEGLVHRDRVFVFCY
jgi:hypothetical protein